MGLRQWVLRTRIGAEPGRLKLMPSLSYSLAMDNSEPQFPHRRNGDGEIYHLGLANMTS